LRPKSLYWATYQIIFFKCLPAYNHRCNSSWFKLWKYQSNTSIATILEYF